MTSDDPFGLENDAGRTRIRPVRKTGQSATQPTRPTGGAAPAPSVAPGARLRGARASDNPLVNAFSPLLGLAPELERAHAPENPDILRERLQDNLTYARDNAVSSGVSLNRAEQATWFVAALLDDIALNTPWGGYSGWPRLPLVTALYGAVDAGERFFDLVEDLMRYPERDPELLELAYLCVCLGFRGKHRVSGPSGEAALAQLRGQMARTLENRDEEDAPLSPHWEGVDAPDEKPRFVVPLWSVGVLTIALVAAIYTALGLRLSAKGEQLYTLADVLPPPERAEIFRPVIETVDPPPQIEIEPVVLEFLPLFKEAAPEETVGALSGEEDVSIARVVLQSSSPEVFRSAKADLNPVYDGLVESIAGVITENIEFVGKVRVVGHTDSVPVQRSNPFQSNQGLSEARAKTIADMLQAAGVPAELVVSEGKAASDPVADNTTAEGRARNRRVEIILQKQV